MDERKLRGTGIVGTLIAAVCCSTPILGVALAAVGLSAWLAWSDYVVIPALAVFLGLTGYALYRLHGRKGAHDSGDQER